MYSHLTKLKWSYLNWEFSIEEIEVAKKYLKMCSSSLTIVEIQIKDLVLKGRGMFSKASLITYHKILTLFAKVFELLLLDEIG